MSSTAGTCDFVSVRSHSLVQRTIEGLGPKRNVAAARFGLIRHGVVKPVLPGTIERLLAEATTARV